MSVRWGQRLAWLIGGLFFGYGLAFSLLPVEMSRWVVGDAPDSPPALIDLRATYGGLCLAAGLIILLLARRSSTLPQALLASAIVLGAMALTRALGMLLEGPGNTMMGVYLASEVLGAVLALWARHRLS